MVAQLNQHLQIVCKYHVTYLVGELDDLTTQLIDQYLLHIVERTHLLQVVEVSAPNGHFPISVSSQLS